MIELYPHQAAYVDKLRVALRRSRKIIAQAATGFGKTVVASYIARSAWMRRNRIIFTVHRRELIRQTQNTFQEFGIPFGTIAAGFPPQYDRLVQIATIQTLKNRLKDIPVPRLVVPDEAHLYGSAGCGEVLDYYDQAGALFLGLTATPWRLDGTGLGNHFNEIVSGPSMQWLIEQGFLSEYRMFAPTTPDVSGVKKRMGDFAIGQLEQVMGAGQIMGDAVKHYLALANGKRALAFCVSIKHSMLTAERFNAAGIPAAHVDGNTPDADRLIAFKAFASGALRVLCNCSLFCEGFDLESQVKSALPVEAVILLRPTQSLTLYLQQVGRALRMKKHPAIILDHAGNSARHGMPDDHREWTLDGRKKLAGGEAPVRQCPKCFFVHRPTPECPGCGFVYPPAPREVEEVAGELAEIKIARRSLERQRTGMAKDFETLVNLGEQRGYKSPAAWARIVLRARNQKALLKENKRLAGV